MRRRHVPAIEFERVRAACGAHPRTAFGAFLLAAPALPAGGEAEWEAQAKQPQEKYIIGGCGESGEGGIHETGLQTKVRLAGARKLKSA
jgi:hypothetical protein